ncbi:MAG: lipid IV(A) 3-deoxy-D-manno-octulosonic acid transferase [Gammaproteobacteria bacterium]|nr:lipid IV(A) 3-deoxy-D-manno-octulosonic acid transferase [Gammaproteobacteria bacterium]
MRFLYNLLTYLLLIPYACYWLVRGLGNRSYLDRLGQRFGIGFPKTDGCIWIHAVSVGEVQATLPLVRALQNRYQDQTILITTVTPTGAARVKSLYGSDVLHAYIPFEFPHAIGRFFERMRPGVAMIMETEIWPNLYRGCGIRDIPLVLVSARISPRSTPGYRRLLPLISETLSHGIIIAAQSQADADRFLELGASSVRTWVTGNIKFDVDPDPSVAAKGKEMREARFGARPVWIAASTHEGEEQQVLEAHRELQKRYPDMLLLLVPRHPERFAGVKELVTKSGFSVVARTDAGSGHVSSDVFLVDTMGEVPLFYAASDVAFVGGSLVPIGGHNLLEPAAQGLPIVTGPHIFNALDIAEKFVDLGACRMVANSDELASMVGLLISDSVEAAELGERGREVLETNRGALERLLVLVEPLLQKAAASR